MTPFVDICTFPYDEASWRGYFDRLVDRAPEYFGRFEIAFTAHFKADRAGYRAALHSGGPQAAADFLLRDLAPFDLDAYLAERARQGVVAEVALGSDRGEINKWVAGLAQAAPGRVHAWAGISLIDPAAALTELRRCVGEGMTGLFVAPVLDGADITDDRFTEVLDFAAGHGLSMYLHTGQHFVRSQPLDITTPRHVDVIASRHPGLTIVAGHAGWPWVLEMLLVAARHDNVYLEISGHRAARMTAPGFGWEPLVQMGSDSLRHKILFGTATWLSPKSPASLAAEVVDLVGADVAADWLHHNANRLLTR